ncbi:hypothetical protein MSMEG_4390 [Mycolicibacterium smegmatis MC2 155]|uniref:Uncharacterized protein n=1 Tax=Mycolicibacterium smegmatis (strain ATCC 700084 / mc(2)155) TaxID=246196 RepID=A0R0H8_MYCS2|nr:hypothetical protein MSMEG_4390 [Mycolicibacterium smegmatis MC2 155]
MTTAGITVLPLTSTCRSPGREAGASPVSTVVIRPCSTTTVASSSTVCPSPTITRPPRRITRCAAPSTDVTPVLPPFGGHCSGRCRAAGAIHCSGFLKAMAALQKGSTIISSTDCDLAGHNPRARNRQCDRVFRDGSAAQK